LAIDSVMRYTHEGGKFSPTKAKKVKADDPSFKAETKEIFELMEKSPAIRAKVFN